MSSMNYGLPTAAIQKIHAVLQRYPQVERAILYGSRAKGNYKRASDIDLTLCGANLALRTLYKILDDLDDLLLPYTMNISIFAALDDPDLIDHIGRVGVLFYDRNTAIPEPIPICERATI
jgi:predicted nucleotidyltransferase